MDKFEGCGLEVSARELVVAIEGKPVQRYASTAAGHRKLVETFTRLHPRRRVVLEATGMYGLDVALRLSATAGVASRARYLLRVLFCALPAAYYPLPLPPAIL